jgi:hypothetical protein
MSFHLHNDKADNKCAAFWSAKTKNAAGKMNHSQENIRNAQSLMRQLEQCIACDEIYINYPKKFITVKVENFRGVADKKLYKLYKLYKLIREDCVAQGIEIGTTDATSMIFRIYK